MLFSEPGAIDMLNYILKMYKFSPPPQERLRGETCAGMSAENIFLNYNILFIASGEMLRKMEGTQIYVEGTDKVVKWRDGYVAVMEHVGQFVFAVKLEGGYNGEVQVCRFSNKLAEFDDNEA